MALMDWMNSGPGPLDLLTPLEHGVQAGQQAQMQKAQIQDMAARQADMKTRLGLEAEDQNLRAQSQEFQQSMWNSQADMRSAQLGIARDNLSLLGTHVDMLAKGQPILNDFTSSLSTMTGDEALNAVIPSGLTEEQSQQATQALTQKRGTAAAQIAADVLSKNQLATAQLHAAGLDPDNFRMPDGKLDLAAAGDALVQFGNDQEKIKTANSASVLNAQTRFNASIYGSDRRAETATSVEATKAATSLARAKLKSATDALVVAAKSYDSKAIAAAQGAVNEANDHLDAISNGASAAPTTPSAPPSNVQSPVDWIHALGQ